MSPLPVQGIAGHYRAIGQDSCERYQQSVESQRVRVDLGKNSHGANTTHCCPLLHHFLGGKIDNSISNSYLQSESKSSLPKWPLQLHLLTTELREDTVQGAAIPDPSKTKKNIRTGRKEKLMPEGLEECEVACMTWVCAKIG